MNKINVSANEHLHIIVSGNNAKITFELEGDETTTSILRLIPFTERETYSNTQEQRPITIYHEDGDESNYLGVVSIDCMDYE